jgi:hypothetical protein
MANSIKTPPVTTILPDLTAEKHPAPPFVDGGAGIRVYSIV